MITLAGAFTWSRPDAGAGLAERLARRACRLPALAHRCVVRTPHLVCFAIERPGSAGRIETWRGEDGSTCLVGGRVLGAGGSLRSVFRPALEEEPGRAVDADGLWLALAVRAGGAGLRLQSDPLGVAWLYLARWEGGCLFSGDYGALLRTIPDTPQLDEETALVTLALSYAPDARTCARGVEMLPGGTLVEVSQRGTSILSTLAPPYGDRHSALPDSKKQELLEGVLEEGIHAWCDEAAPPLVLSLSGGNDSRFALAHLARRGNPPRCVTFGHPRSPDVRAARATARRAGLTTRIFYRRDVTSWPAWRRCIEQVGTTGGFQWSGWAEDWLAFVRESGGSALLGYLGDTYSGKNLADLPGHPDDWFENWIAWSLDEGWSGSPLLTTEAQRNMEAAVRERFRAIVEGLRVAYPHQIQVHLGLAGRLRRHVAAQPNLMARFVDPVLFFYTSAQRRFWTNLPYEDLRDQRLYLAYAANRFPRLFPPEHRASIPARAAGAARHWAISHAPSLRPWLAPPEIDIARHVTENRGQILELLEDAGPIVGHWFRFHALREALASFPTSRRITAFQAVRLASLLLVLQAGAPRGPDPPVPGEVG
ncbi:MAG TPA: hypothetical protein VID50_02115 [Candidatus Eisenbacteria bacterium]|jgi:hypothetical protein